MNPRVIQRENQTLLLDFCLAWYWRLRPYILFWKDEISKYLFHMLHLCCIRCRQYFLNIFDVNWRGKGHRGSRTRSSVNQATGKPWICAFVLLPELASLVECININQVIEFLEEFTSLPSSKFWRFVCWNEQHSERGCYTYDHGTSFPILSSSCFQSLSIMMESAVFL